MIFRLTLSAVLSTCFLLSFSQQKAVRINSGETIETGIKLYDEGKYKEALKEFEKVPVGDTNYGRALYESALVCSADSQFARGIEFCRKGLSDRSNPERDPEFLVLYGALLDYNNEQDRALNTYDSAMRSYPAYINLPVAKGTTLIRMKKYREAENLLQQTALMSPYSSSVHYKLGLSALYQGKVIPGFLCILASLTIEPSSSYTENAIKLLNEISKSTDEITDLVNKREEAPSDNFRLIEQILLSKIALDKSYKIITDLDDNISRQMQVVFEKLKIDDNDQDFYMQYYVPLYKNIYEDKKFEYFVNYVFSGVNLPAIQQFNKKKKKDIDALKTGIIEYFKLVRATRELHFSKRNYNGPCYQFSDDGLYAKGIISRNLPTGPWTFYFPAGNKKSEGLFNDKGEKEGAFSYYYFTGQLKAKEFFRNGKEEGMHTYYSEQGTIESSAPYKDGQPHGEYTSYYTNGVIKSIEPYTNGQLNGIKKIYYKSGPLQMEETYVNGKRQGPAKTYYLNGQPDTEGAYIDDELNGNFKSWNNDGVLVAEGTYTQGKLTGPLKRYHENGKLQSIENYDNKGILEGEYLSYHENGTEAYRYMNKKGKTTGDVNYYDDDGKLFTTLRFENDKLKSGLYFDKTGKQISNSELKNGRLDLVTYTPDGTKKTLTPYGEKGELEGTKIYYFGSGKEKLRESYKNGLLNGAVIGYHQNSNKNYSTEYADNQKNGYFTSWYTHGGKREEGWYSDGLLQGEWLNYDKQGSLSSKSFYLNDTRNGTRTDFWPNGKAHSVYLYEKDNLQSLTEYDTLGKVINRFELNKGSGKFISHYPNGKLYIECSFVNNDIEGTKKIYFPDGSLMMVQHYVHGMLDSNFTSYSFGGKVRVEGRYKWNEKQGTWKYYNSEGILYSTEEYKSGILQGKTIFYHLNGKIETEVEYKNDERHGLYKRYAEDGSFMYQLRYDEGAKLGYSYLNRNGELVPEIPLIQENGKLNAFYQNGNPSASMEYVDGVLNGAYTLYHPNGKIAATQQESFDDTEGVSTQYYADGKLRASFNYVHDNLHGPYKEYNAKGILTEEGNYYDDSLHGEQRVYDSTGKLRQVRFYYYGLLLEVK
jgi:antitoxin component YwqK of YwqJK toxin-antitoxin module